MRQNPKGEGNVFKQFEFNENKEVSFDERPSAEEVKNLFNEIKNLTEQLIRCRRILTIDDEFQGMLNEFYDLTRKITGQNINKNDYRMLDMKCRELSRHLLDVMIDFNEVSEE